MRFFILFFLFCSPLVGEENILVELQNQCTLAPLYLEPIEQSTACFPKSYLTKLRHVLAFDLQHNGYTTISHKASTIKEPTWRAFDHLGWQKEKIAFVVKTKIEKNTLSVLAYDVQKNQIKGIDGVVLTGNLNQDRKKVHVVSDAIVKGFFGIKGIASTRILFTVRHKKQAQDAAKWVSEVYESDYDGHNAKKVTSENSLIISPTYLPPTQPKKSHNFFYVSYKLGQPKLFVGNTLKNISQRLSYIPGNQLMPAISPDKTAVAFIGDPFGNPDLFLQPFTLDKGMVGNARCLYSSSFGAQASPTFSPDGHQLAFVSNKDGSPRIYTLTIPEKGKGTPLLLTKQNRENTSPAWSPDGKKLAYSAKVNGIRQIWIYDFATKKEWPLTSGPMHKENPTFAPDSLHLIYNTENNEKGELFLINLNQKKAIQITSGSGVKRFPSWEKC